MFPLDPVFNTAMPNLSNGKRKYWTVKPIYICSEQKN